MPCTGLVNTSPKVLFRCQNIKEKSEHSYFVTHDYDGPGRLLNVLCAFNLRPASTGEVCKKG